MDMLEQIIKSVQKNLPGDIPGDIKKNVEGVVRGTLEKMNLVSREQFDVQQKVLERTRSRVDELEEKIIKLEKRLDRESADAPN